MGARVIPRDYNRVMRADNSPILADAEFHYRLYRGARKSAEDS